MFMNQTKMMLIGQFLGIIVLCHVLILGPIVPIIANVPEYQWHDVYMRSETITQIVSVLLSVASIVLQLYVSCKRQSSAEARGDILSANPPQVQFTSLATQGQNADSLEKGGGQHATAAAQKISIATLDEHSEMTGDNSRDGGAGVNNSSYEAAVRQSAIPRLMKIITIMTCILCTLMVLDIFLWADLYYRASFSCWHYLLSQISFVGFFFKFWMLPAALLFGCRSLREEVNICKCFGAIGRKFTSGNSQNVSSSRGKHRQLDMDNDDDD